MEVNLEFIKFDTEDKNNHNFQGGEYPFGIEPSKEDIYFYLCYYKPIQYQYIHQENKSNLVQNHISGVFVKSSKIDNLQKNIDFKMYLNQNKIENVY